MNIARSLRKLGVHCVVGLIGDREPALPSRAIDGFIRLPADVSSDEFVLALSDPRMSTSDMIMPCSDAALSAIVHHEAILRTRYRMTCPPARIITRVLDKSATLAIAARCGIPIPKSHEIASIAHLEALRSAIRFPVVAKPATHQARRGFVIRYFTTFESLRAAIEAEPGFCSRNVIQEFATGRGVGISMLIRDGNAIAAFQHARLKEMPASGGASVLAESEPLDAGLAGAALSLLRALEWSGVAMVEFRRDDPDGSWVLLEVNGRYWGSLPVALLAGVDFPRYDWQIAHGLEVEVPTKYRAGIRMRWMAGDIDRLLGVLLRLPADSPTHPSRLRELARFIGDFNPSTKSALWSIADPGPAVSDIFHYFGRMIKAVVHRCAISIFGRESVERWHQVRTLGRAATLQYLRLRIKRILGLGPRFDSRITPITGSILFVCKGNQFRSAFCAAAAERMIASMGSTVVHVDSAGLEAVPGGPANPLAIAVGEEMGLRLGGHAAQPVTAELVSRADIVFVMDYLNAADFLSRFDSPTKNMYLLGTPDGDALGEIGDPDGKPIEEVRACFETIAARLTQLFRG